MSGYYLDEGLPRPKATPLDAAYWEGLKENELRIQRCRSCGKWQWGPEWICHHCLSDDLEFCSVDPVGHINSYEWVWHPVHPALAEQGAYLIVLVELAHADNVRVVGNLIGDPTQEVVIGAAVKGVFEHHLVEEPYTLLQWEQS